jgi:hypothetical protein
MFDVTNISARASVAARSGTVVIIALARSESKSVGWQSGRFHFQYMVVRIL